MTGWLGSSVVECSHGQRKALGSSPGRATMFHLLHHIFCNAFVHVIYSVVSGQYSYTINVVDIKQPFSKHVKTYINKQLY